MHRSPWTNTQLDELRRLYPDHAARFVAEHIGRTVLSVYEKAHALGLTKSDAFFASDLSGRIKRGRTDPRIVATQIKPGNVPWNKGTKGVVGVQPACRATQFKPGNKPRNTQPIGSYRVNKDGHLQRKVSDAKGSNSMRWRGVAELIWCAAHGQLPPNHLVVFRPGRFTAVLEEITLDRLECITRAENMRRNTIHARLPPEVQKLAQLKGAITRQVNRIIKESNP